MAFHENASSSGEVPYRAHRTSVEHTESISRCPSSRCPSLPDMPGDVVESGSIVASVGGAAAERLGVCTRRSRPGEDAGNGRGQNALTTAYFELASLRYRRLRYRRNVTSSQTALLTELEPVVAANLDRHLSLAKDWQPQDYVPWSRGRD